MLKQNYSTILNNPISFKKSVKKIIQDIDSRLKTLENSNSENTGDNGVEDESGEGGTTPSDEKTEKQLLPPYTVEDWTYLEVSDYENSPQGITSDGTKVTLGKYERNIYKVPFKRGNKYRVTFKNGWGGYIGLSNSYSTLQKWETVYVTTSNSFESSSQSQNVVDFNITGENFDIIINDTTTQTKTIPLSYGDDLYLIFYQNNDKNPAEIINITENPNTIPNEEEINTIPEYLTSFVTILQDSWFNDENSDEFGFESIETVDISSIFEDSQANVLDIGLYAVVDDVKISDPFFRITSSSVFKISNGSPPQTKSSLTTALNNKFIKWTQSNKTNVNIKIEVSHRNRTNDEYTLF